MGYNVYDFNRLIDSIIDLTAECPNKRKDALSTIKIELNRFFTDFKCTEVLFTNNTDNEFFGIQIMPAMKYESDYKRLFDPDSKVRYDHYMIEFDSKLFDGEFTALQILALMIHDINQMNNANRLYEAIATIDFITVCSGELIKVEDVMVNLPFFIFALQDTVRKMTSVFEFIPANLALADDFIRSYELDNDYEEGMFAVKKCRNNLEYQVPCTSITMQWYMHKLSQTTHAYADLVDDLKDAIRMTGSKLVRRILEQSLELIVTCTKYSVDGRTCAYYKALTEAANKKKMSLASQIKYSGLKSLEDDVYEYRMRIKNVETENDAIYIIRQINNRMGIISDYLDTEDLSDTERERFFKLYDKYDGLREELSKKSIYSRKMYGLFVDYNALQQMSNNSMTMNTYY